MSNLLENQTIRINTPDGEMFVVVTEKKDKSIDSIKIIIGKAGASVAAWADALASMMTLAIEKGATLEELIALLSNITSDRTARTINKVCRSGPEGVWMALVRYRKDDALIEIDDDLVYSGSRGASVAPWARVRKRG